MCISEKRSLGASLRLNLVAVVYYVLARREHSSVGAVAAAMGVSSAAATKAIARLERKGLVTRSVDLMDRRCVKVSGTSMGAAVVRR